MVGPWNIRSIEEREHQKYYLEAGVVHGGWQEGLPYTHERLPGDPSLRWTTLRSG